MENNTELSKLDKEVKIELFKKLTVFAIGIFVVLIFMTGFVAHDIGIQDSKLIDSYILELRSDNHTGICNILDCSYFINFNGVAYKKEGNTLVISDTTPFILFELGGDVITADGELGFMYKSSNHTGDDLYILKSSHIVKIFGIYTLVMGLIIAGLLYSWLVRLSAKSRVNEMMNSVGKEAALANKNMNILTENISHEAKTPLMVISSSIEDIKYQVDSMQGTNCKFAGNCDKYIDSPEHVKLLQSFDLLEMNVNSIYTIIERIRDFKKVKYSNGNKTIFNIANASRNIMHLYKKIKFKIELDDNLNNYRLIKLKNEDLMNILTNHIKNSVEAMSTSIAINCGDLNGDLLSIFVIDNGNGVPPEVQNCIFDANFSTKETGDIRGVGLYLSKELLESTGGKTKLYETSSQGTVFELRVPAKLKE